MIHAFQHNRILIAAILFTYLNAAMYGCSSSGETPANKDPIKISRIETTDGKVVEFWNSKLGYAVMGENEIVCIKKNGDKTTIPIKNVKKIYIKNESPINTPGILIAGIVILCVVIAVTMKPLHGGGLFSN